MRIKTLVALSFWILEFDDVTCIRSISTSDALPPSYRRLVVARPLKGLGHAVSMRTGFFQFVNYMCQISIVLHYV